MKEIMVIKLRIWFYYGIFSTLLTGPCRQYYDPFFKEFHDSCQFEKSLHALFITLIPKK